MLLPAATGLGAAEFVVIKSACVTRATTSAAVALLLTELGSVTAELTLTVSLIAVPAAVPPFTFRASVKLPDPGATLGLVQVMAPVPFTAGVTHDHPAGGVIDWKVVLAGVVSVKLAVVAELGPEFVTTCVYVMLLPACTGTGFAKFVIERSAESPTCTPAVALLFVLVGSPVVEATESVCVIVVPDATFVFTVTTKVKFAVVPDVIVVVSVQVSVASTHVHPAVPVSDTALVFAGSVSVKTGAFAVAGPL